MSSEENVDIVRRGYAAFSAGELEAFDELFTDDAVWHVPGSGSLSGAKNGRDVIVAYFGELMSRSGGTVRVTLQDVIAGDNHTIGLHHSHAERNGRILDQNAVLVFALRDGRVSEVREFNDDTARNDEFWSEPPAVPEPSLERHRVLPVGPVPIQR